MRNITLSDIQMEKSQHLANRLKFVHIICDIICNNRIQIPYRREVARIFAKMTLPPLSDTIFCHTIYGFDLCISKDSGVNYYYFGFYEKGTMHIINKCLQKGDIFVDAGSSVGQMSLLASKIVGSTGRVLAFEPHTGRYSDLLNSIVKNNCKNITAFNVGLGMKNGEIRLYKDRCSPSMVKKKDDEPFEIVKIMTLDTVLTNEGIHNVHMIKIDVEGFELAVLKGANHLFKSLNAPIICIEYSNLHPLKNEKILDTYNYILSINNYKIYKLKKVKEYPSRLIKITNIADLPCHDNLFCFLPTHLNKLSTDLFN